MIVFNLLDIMVINPQHTCIGRAMVVVSYVYVCVCVCVLVCYHKICGMPRLYNENKVTWDSLWRFKVFVRWLSLKCFV